MVQGFLSDIELYYTPSPVEKEIIVLVGEEAHHIKNVMRHKVGDDLYVTDGAGTIYKTTIGKISEHTLECRITDKNIYPNQLHNIYFCIPRLKNQDRFDFALEKSVELGITNFIVFESSRTVSKGEKLERWQKTLLSAMKQSLRAWLPKISYIKNFRSIAELEGRKIIFDQNASQTSQQFLSTNHQSLITDNCFFLFGPEGGFANEECRMMNVELTVRLTENRLRSETAIIAAATEIALKLIRFYR